MRKRALLPFAIALFTGLSPSPAHATEVTGSEFSSLVRQAQSEPEALDRLRQVTAVDGRPVDLELVLDASSEEELETRLRTLAEARGEGGSLDARAEASEILADRRYRESEPPRPFKGVIDWLNDRFGGSISGFDDFITRALPGGFIMFWLLIAVLVVIGAVLMAGRATGRAGRQERAPGPGAPREKPEHLEREADEAERSGDLEGSLRLRFRAGLLRLSERGALPRRSSLTSEEIAQRLGSPTFNTLAATFDRVVYGRQPATVDDAEEARRGWRAVLHEVRA